MPEPDSEAVLHYTCPSCQANLRARNSDTGKRRKCPQCDQPMKVPGVPRTTRTSSSAADRSNPGPEVGRAVTPTGAKIIFPCPQCKSRLLARPDQAGQSILCEECLETVIIPEISVTNGDASTPQTTPAREPAETAPTPVKVPEPAAEEDSPQPQQTDSSRTETVIPQSFGILCAVCGTRLYAHQSQIGSRIPCPDCYATTKVRSPKPVKQKKPKTPAAQVTRKAKPEKTPGQFAIEKAQQELQLQEETIGERESKSRFENLYHFLLLPDIVLRLITFSLLFIFIQILFLFAAQFTTGLMAILGMLLSVAGLVVGGVTLLVALPTAIIIIIETGNGNYEVDGLPGVNIMEFVAQALYMITCLLVLLIPYTVLNHILSPLGDSVAPLVTTLICAGALPILLLSSLEANAPFIIWSAVISQSILEKTSCWLALWKTTALLLVGQYLVEQLISKVLPVPPLQLIIHALLTVTVSLVYCRAIGLLAWETSKLPRQKPA